MAACRWPEKFLAADPGKLDRTEYANLLALVARKQPRLRDEVLKKITAKELEAAESRLREPNLADLRRDFED